MAPTRMFLALRNHTSGGVYAEYITLMSSIAAVVMGATFALAPRVLAIYHAPPAVLANTTPTPAPLAPPTTTSPHLPSPPTTPSPAPHTTPEPPTPAPAPPPTPSPPPPIVAPFDFGSRTFAWNTTTWRATSPYVDIEGVHDTPVPYIVTGTGRPVAQANVEGGPSAFGVLRHGTDLQVDVPAPGGTHTATLTIDGRSGSFTVRTLPIADHTVHYGGQLWLWIPVHWEGRTFSISGQGNPGAQPNGGNTQAYASLPDGRITQGVAKNGFNLVVNIPPSGQRHQLIVTIDGHSSSFAIIRP